MHGASERKITVVEVAAVMVLLLKSNDQPTDANGTTGP